MIADMFGKMNQKVTIWILIKSLGIVHNWPRKSSLNLFFAIYIFVQGVNIKSRFFFFCFCS